MRWTRARDQNSQSGIALFMVISSISVLSILVTEFVYVAQVNQTMAFDGLDQLKAHYLAKTGLKISLLRLKAYQHIKQYAGGMLKAAGAGDQANAMRPLLDKIWNFPFYYPIPTNIPGITPTEKEQIKAFEKASGLEGKFSTFIVSESSKYNLNMILAGFAPSPSPAASPSASPAPEATATATPAPSPSFNPQAARESLKDFLSQLLAPKMEEDPAFADAYRDPHLLEDLVDNIAGWADRSYERKGQTGDITMKQAPFYSVSELHMVPGMDDDLYALFAPNLTVSRTPGINVNSMNVQTLRALFPQATKEEAEKFITDRDSEEEDGKFKSEDDFYKYIKGNFVAYQRGDTLDQLRKAFSDNRIRFVVDETVFKITVQAQVNQSTRLIEAWVSLSDATKSTTSSPTPSPNASKPPTPSANPMTGNNSATPTPPDAGLKIHFMRFL